MRDAGDPGAQAHPGSSATTVTSTTPVSSVGPEQLTNAARGSVPSWPTHPKSVSRHPGGSGHGSQVGRLLEMTRYWANPSYSGSTARHNGTVSPCTGQAHWSLLDETGDGQRGQPASKLIWILCSVAPRCVNSPASVDPWRQTRRHGCPVSARSCATTVAASS